MAELSESSLLYGVNINPDPPIFPARAMQESTSPQLSISKKDFMQTSFDQQRF